MPQNLQSGRRGNNFGHYVAGIVADHLGIDLFEGKNEGLYSGNRIVIKTGRRKTGRFGITSAMLQRLSGVILAKEHTLYTFDLYYIDLSTILPHKTDSRSSGHQGGRVKSFSFNKAIEYGEKIGQLHINYGGI